MNHVRSTFGSLVVVLAFVATTLPAFTQSPQDPVSSDGSTALPLEVSAGSVAPSFGLRTITESALAAEGVEFDHESREEFRRLAALPDGGKFTSEVDTEVIIGSDTRERLDTTTFPTRARVLVTFTDGRCSGTLIGANTVATAGHCLHTGGPSGSWRPTSSFRIYAGRDGTLSPYGVCTARTLYSVVGWTVNRREEHDYGAIKLNCTVGNAVGSYGFAAKTPTDFPTIIGGYPGDKPLTHWTSSDRVRALTTRQLFYRNDTVGGQSGSPVWHDPNGPYMIGIHGYGTHGSGDHAVYNHGTLINSAVFNNLLAWRNAP